VPGEVSETEQELRHREGRGHGQRRRADRLLMQGTLSADNDVDFWTFITVDTDELTTNSYT
jgi:hypothetical protein